MSAPKIKELVLDVLKPLTTSLPEFAIFLGELPNVSCVVVILVERDERTESLEVILYGPDINFEGLNEYMSRYGAVIHSVDKVSVE